jgi:GH15 family glucan-1,4-alpha-glucosidase
MVRLGNETQRHTSAEPRFRYSGKAALNYKPIKAYGAIGNTRTAALVSLDGSVDWCCLPRFDSPSVFAKLIDAKKGGAFKICPAGRYVSSQKYDDDTNVLKTIFKAQLRRIEITDFMPVDQSNGTIDAPAEIVRIVRCLRGPVEMLLEFDPRFDYGRKAATITATPEGLVAYEDTGRILLTCSRPKLLTSRICKFTTRSRESICFSAVYVKPEDSGFHSPTTELDIETKLQRTKKFWQDWMKGCRYSGRWPKVVRRSALTLKLLSYSPTGAIVAAATTSLPEVIGGSRNWDYRYCWIRDSCFALWPLHRIGFEQEADRFVDWLLQKCKQGIDERQIMFGVEGERDLQEKVLPHLDGYRKSRPVRIGNAAYTQFQLDIYGEILDAIHYLHKEGSGVLKHEYGTIRELADFICKWYNEPDCGIWEVRNDPKSFVYSKLWCWVGVERASRIAKEMHFEADADRWTRTAEKIRTDILTKGWSNNTLCFRQHYDTTEPDAANLLMPLVGFIEPTDEKFKMNLRTTMDQLGRNGFLYRYQAEDGLPGEEGTFTLCTLWAVACLARSDMTREAKRLFDKILGQANHVGLFSEQFDPATGDALGNFPQAFTHLNLITAALELDAAIERAQSGEHAKGVISATKSVKRMRG